jgi:hypothetical protein
MTVTIVIFGAIALLLILFRIVHGDAAQISSLTELPRSTEPIDLPAFLNLIDPAEEKFLKANLTPKVFRQVQRQRLLASVEYVRRAARNAGVLVRLGEAVSAEANSDVSDLGREITATAIKLRALALLALCFLYVRIALPDVHLSLLQVPTRYEYLIEEVTRLARLKQLVQVNRILSVL